MPLNILLIVVSPDEHEQHTIGELPLGAGYLASYVKKHVDDCSVSVSVGAADASMAAGYDLVGISAVTDNFTVAAKIAADIRRLSRAPIIFGGHHISYLPQLLPRAADAGVLYEGEVTFLELVRSFIEHRHFTAAALREIPGIVFWDGEALVRTPPRELIQDMDSIPFPDREVIAYNQGRRMQHHIMTSRGCPYHCRFCSSSPFWQHTRYFGPEYVAAEIQYLQQRYGLRKLHIYDDLWIANKKRFFQIAELMKQLGLPQKMSFGCWVTARTFTPEVARELKALNFESVMIGFESGSDKVVRYLKHGSATVEQNCEAVRTAREVGIRIGGSFIIGSPGETADDMLATKRFIAANQLDDASLFLLKPLPGTDVWKHALRAGLVTENMPDWGVLNNDDILSEKAILLSDLDPLVLQALRAEIQAEIDRQHLRSTARHFALSRVGHYAKAALANPGRVFSALRSLWS
jgi:anaerobic magnesium-protoporphyrin IX monomethyl ester cyclase